MSTQLDRGYLVKRLFRIVVLFGALLTSANQSASASTPLAVELVASGIANPSYLTAPPGDASRLFVTELNTGNIRIIKDGVLLPDPFMTVLGVTTGAERGLLCMAFDPDYANNGFFYVSYTRSNGSVIRRYNVSPDPDIADTTSGLDITSFIPPQNIHIGGWIGFDEQGHFYVAKGDAGTFLTAQNDSVRHGKILRLDVQADGSVSIPPDNPYANEWAPRNQQWAKGLRNPWRCSFDRATGDLYIGDVGNTMFEEINHEPGGSLGGRNYGWPMFEGEVVWNCPEPCDSTGLTRPIHTYQHAFEPPVLCAVIGGYVYRGAAIPALAGEYFFADLCGSIIWSTRVVDGVATEITDRTAQLQPELPLDMNGIQSFGEDASGELYILNSDGEVYRIIADPTAVGHEGSVVLGSAPSLGMPVPHPSRDGVSLRASIEESSEAWVHVFDASGRRVRTFATGFLNAGAHTIRWNGRSEGGHDVAGGTYFLRFETNGGAAVRKVTLVR